MADASPTTWALPLDGEDDRYLVYQPLDGVAFVGNGSLARLAGTSSPEAAREASPEGADFLRSIGFRSGEPTWAPTTPDEGLRSAVLLTTNQCQLRCTYCYAAAGEAPARELSLERAETAIDEVVKAATSAGQTSFEVSFHGGGEPTRAWDLIRAATEYARRQPIPATVTLTSNGMWSAAQCRWIIDNIDGITISVDGSPATQDRNRPRRGGHPSSPVIMRNLTMLEAAGRSVGIRMTAARPWTDLAEDVRYLLEHTPCRFLRVEPAFNDERGGHVEPGMRDVDDFGEAFLAAWDVARSYGARLVYTGADVSTAKASFCSAPSNALIVTPTGDVVTCYEVTDDAHPLAPVSTIGHLDPGSVAVDIGRRRRVQSMIAERREACQDCYCYWTCAGDCYARSFRPGPDGHLVRGLGCELNRTLTVAILLRMVAEGGGVWHRSPTSSPRTLAPIPAAAGRGAAEVR